MKELTPEQIEANWKEFLGYIETYITGDRKKQLLKFYTDRDERFMFMPASAVDFHHSAFPGGYVDHVNRVVRLSLQTLQMWKDAGSPINASDEEIVFTALNHDLGKYGNDDEPYYIPNPSDWHRKNQGKIYDYNTNLPKMDVPLRGIMLLTQNGITLTETEFIGIKTHDGLYDESNKYYLMGFNWAQKLKSSLSYIVHQADMIAARVEFEEWRDNYRDGAELKPKKAKVVSEVSTAQQPISDSAKTAFDDLFK